MTDAPNPLNSGQVRVAGTGAFWRAPAGSTLPTDSTTAWDAAFKNLGFATDGFTVTPNFKTTTVTGWQKIGVLRNITTDFDFKFSFELLQTNIDTIAMAWGNATVVPGLAGAYSLTLGDPSEEFVLGVDWSDGALNQRIIIESASLATLPTVKNVRSDGTRYAFEVQTLIPASGHDQVQIFGVDSFVSGV